MVRLSQAGYKIPLMVIEQWIYPHYYNHHTVNNYGWIDFRYASFFKVKLLMEDIRKLNVIKDYQSYVKNRSNYPSIEDFSCVEKDKRHWKNYSTWRVPPIAIDITTLSNIPSYSDLPEPFQLVEGHTRLGYLLALEKMDMLETQEHTVFMLKVTR